MNLKQVTTAVAITFASFGLAQAETFKAVTADNLSPFSRGADKELPGFNHEFVVMIAERAGVDIAVEYLPWKRAQKVAEEGSNTLVFGLTRNEKREPKYDWVTNLLSVERVFLTTGDAVNSYEDAESLPTIGARSVYYRALDGKGWTNVQEGEVAANLKKLEAGRVDAVFTAAARAVFAWTQELGLEQSALTVGQGVGTSHIWLAASKGFPADVAAKLDAAAKELMADGSYETLYKKYFGDLPMVAAAN